MRLLGFLLLCTSAFGEQPAERKPDRVISIAAERFTFNGLLARLQTNDMDLRATLEQLTEARDAAEAANVLKSQFLANMSHEIRTPLNGVLAMAQIMGMGDLSDTQRERLNVVRQSGEALLAILNDVLDLSKIEAGKMELEPIEFELADIARHAEAAYGEMAKRKGLNLIIMVDPAAEGRRFGDVGRLRQIASNLVSNALKFTDRGEVRLALHEKIENGREMLHLTAKRRRSGDAEGNGEIVRAIIAEDTRGLTHE